MQKSTVSIQKLYIKKRPLEDYLVIFLLFMPFLIGLIIDTFSLPTSLRFAQDGVLLCLLGIMAYRYDNRIRRELMPILIYFAVFTAILFFSYLVNFQSLFYLLWGFRNNFRFFFAFLAFVRFVKFDDIEMYLKIFDALFWINFFVCLVQFFVFGYKQDFLGGLFGTSVGCNIYMNVFLCIITSKSLIWFINKKEKFIWVILKLAASFLIGALAELKFFYIEFIVILCIVSLITRFTWKKVLIIVAGVVGVVAGVAILIQIFPEYVGQFTLELLYESAVSDRGYTSSGDINRLSAISTISKEIFNKGHQFFVGMGLGNCDLSSISVFNTPFYESHQSLHYNWFSHAFMFLETGYIGLIMFFGIFFLFFFMARSNYKKGYSHTLYSQLAMTIALLCMMFAIYNTSLRVDSVYMISFVLALAFIPKKKKDDEEFSLTDITVVNQ